MLHKKKFTGALCSLLCVSFAATISLAHADETTNGLSQVITLDGEITSGSCTVDFPTSISFADIDVKDLKAPDHATTYNSLTPPTGEQTVISLTACTPQQQVSVTLSGTADANDTQALANDASESPAKYVGMRAFIRDPELNSVELSPNVATGAYSADETGKLSLELWPGLLKTSPSLIPTAGKVHITGQIKINYL